MFGLCGLSGQSYAGAGEKISSSRICPYPIPLVDFYDAYEACRQHTRHTAAAQLFELDYEKNLEALYKEVNSGTYKISPATAFVVREPVPREIFASAFRDRVIQHLVVQKILPLLEKQNIQDSYACRRGKGTHAAIRRLDHFIRSCSQNYTKECWILKLDIKGFFMSIDRTILYRQLLSLLTPLCNEPSFSLVLALISQIIFHDPTTDCIIKRKRSDWNLLPQEKSLFHAKKGCGLPLGNYTSQILANFYLSSFDHFSKHDLRIRRYVRYGHCSFEKEFPAISYSCCPRLSCKTSASYTSSEENVSATMQERGPFPWNPVQARSSSCLPTCYGACLQDSR
ncbi:MAG: hypothetical protein LKE40_00120 [Spirochaetia bacterium]|nr:hypothetical protein [Spirochaetia bacterium]